MRTTIQWQMAGVRVNVRAVVFGVLVLVIVALRAYYAATRPVLLLDESAYLWRTVRMVDNGYWPDLSQSPGVSYMHALSYVFLRPLALGLDYAGRVTTFVGGLLVYAGVFLSARRLLGQWAGVAAVALALFYPPLHELGDNASDLLFAAALACILYALVLVGERATWRRVALLSALVGVALLFRNDGLPLFLALTPFILWRNWRAVLAWLLPFVAVVGFAVGMAYVTGDVLVILPTERSYDAFEQGEGIAQRFWITGNPFEEGPKLAAKLYGSRAENGDSVLRAIQSNPAAWLDRVRWNVRDSVLTWQEANGGGWLLFGVVAVAGAVALWRRHRWLVLSVVVLFAPMVAYFLLSFWLWRYWMAYSPVVVLLMLAALWTLHDRRMIALAVVALALAGAPSIWPLPVTAETEAEQTLQQEKSESFAAYIRWAHATAPGARVCTMGDPSLVWYARQVRIVTPGNLKTQLDKLLETANKQRCGFVFLRGQAQDSQLPTPFELAFNQRNVWLWRVP